MCIQHFSGCTIEQKVDDRIPLSREDIQNKIDLTFLNKIQNLKDKLRSLKNKKNRDAEVSLVEQKLTKNYAWMIVLGSIWGERRMSYLYDDEILYREIEKTVAQLGRTLQKGRDSDNEEYIIIR